MPVKKRNYGWQRDFKDPRDLMYKAPSGSITIPSLVDLRPSFDWPVEDQGNLGSCVAQALVSNMEFFKLQMIHGSKAVMGQKDFFNLSRLFLYYEARKLDGMVTEDSGAQIRNGVKALSKVGVCLEEIWPYKIKDFAKKPSVSGYNDAKERIIKSYVRLNSLNDMLQCLMEGYPFVFGVTIFTSFEKAKKSGKVPMPSLSDDLIGGHAMCAVGFIKAERTFIVRNSWGQSWGCDGYCYIPWAYLEKFGADFWSVRNK